MPRLSQTVPYPISNRQPTLFYLGLHTTIRPFHANSCAAHLLLQKGKKNKGGGGRARSSKGVRHFTNSPSSQESFPKQDWIDTCPSAVLVGKETARGLPTSGIGFRRQLKGPGNGFRARYDRRFLCDVIERNVTVRKRNGNGSAVRCRDTLML